MRIAMHVLAVQAVLTAAVADVVKTVDGKVEGRVSAMSPLEVTVSQDGSTKTVPVNQIESISFDEEPALLRRAREAVAADRYEEASKALENVKTDEIERPEILQDIEFYAALSEAKLALRGDLEIREAGKRMRAFLTNHPNNFHHLEACAVVGDLLAALGQYAGAREYYERVGKAPWPEYKLRASAAMGQLLLAEKKPEEALKYFQHVLDAKAEGERAAAQRSIATLGKARCLLQLGKHDESLQLANAVIAGADPDDAELLGQAFLVVGIAQQKAGRLQDAMFALLRVDTMYPQSRDAHAEALAHLVEVFTALKKEDRARDARRALEDQYGDTRWAKGAE